MVTGYTLSVLYRAVVITFFLAATTRLRNE